MSEGVVRTAAGGSSWSRLGDITARMVSRYGWVIDLMAVLVVGGLAAALVVAGAWIGEAWS